MPSYKEKFSTLSSRMDALEKKVLIDEDVLLELKSRIDELSRVNDSFKQVDLASVNQKNQLILALVEIEELLFDGRQTPADAQLRNTSEIIDIITGSLHRIGKLIRDSHVRANTILDGLHIKTEGKLLKRERREQMRKESISSLAASLSQSQTRLVSPPPINRARDASVTSNQSSRSRV